MEELAHVSQRLRYVSAANTYAEASNDQVEETDAAVGRKIGDEHNRAANRCRKRQYIRARLIEESLQLQEVVHGSFAPSPRDTKGLRKHAWVQCVQRRFVE